jgi:sn-glycerol 3-phosphate transport system permease protein
MGASILIPRVVLTRRPVRRRISSVGRGLVSTALTTASTKGVEVFGPRRRRRQSFIQRQSFIAWLFLLPSLVGLGIFIFYPLVRSVYLSMHGNDIFGGAGAYVGTRNYAQMLASSNFRHVLLITLLFTLLTVVPGVLGALAVVLLLESRVRATRVFRTAFAIPLAFSSASASVVFAVIYNPAIGVANGVLGQFGIDRIGWLTDPSIALLSVSITTVWMQFGFGVLVLAAGVGGISPEIFEAARLDGANGGRLARSITIPLLGPQLFFLVVVSTIHALQSFGQIHILTRGGPDGATTTLVYSIYEQAFAFGSSNFGLASAQALVLLLIVLACTALQFGVLERKVHYS